MRRAALLVCVGAVVLWPALQPHRGDGFPLSTYPMFSRDSGSVVAITTVVGLDARGHEHRLDPRVIGGGDEVMLAAEAARVAARDGSAAEYCTEVADRVRDPDLVTLEVRTEVRDAVADVGGERPPQDMRVHARCEVGR